MRNMEIGSIYEINSESFAGACREDAERLALGGTKKYGKKNVRYTASGREAIALALKSLEAARPGIAKRCLLPGVYV